MKTRPDVRGPNLFSSAQVCFPRPKSYLNRLSLRGRAQGSADAADVCQTVLPSRLPVLRPLPKDGMWQCRLHPPCRFGLFVSLFLTKVSLLKMMASQWPHWSLLRRCCCFFFSVLVVSSPWHMLTSHLSWPFSLYKVMTEQRSHEHALVYLLYWLDFPLLSSQHQHGEFGQCLKGRWCIWTG